MSTLIDQLNENRICEQATGCLGAGAFRAWAEREGYPYCEVFDWTSSAGDWSFIVSKDGIEWFPMFQENRYPRGPGFDRSIDTSRPYYGAVQEVFEQISSECA